eukprot:scaffold6417_cov95-Isochrysis_galbana.AAC.6
MRAPGGGCTGWTEVGAWWVGSGGTRARNDEALPRKSTPAAPNPCGARQCLNLGTTQRFTRLEVQLRCVERNCVWGVLWRWKGKAPLSPAYGRIASRTRSYPTVAPGRAGNARPASSGPAAAHRPSAARLPPGRATARSTRWLCSRAER